MNGKPGPPRKVPTIRREGDRLIIVPANISPITIRTRRLKITRREAGRCQDCGKRRTIPKHRTEPFTHRCAGCQRTANALYRRWSRRQHKTR